MPRTVANLIESVRALINDERSPFRYSDAQILISISDGIDEARRIRPDLFINDLLEDRPPYTTANLNDNLPLPNAYFTPLVNYVAGRMQLRDDQFSQDGRAVMLVSAYGTALSGGQRR